MSLLDTASLVVTPNGTKAGKLYSVVPSDGAGDLSVTRATSATRVNSSGLIESVASNVPRLDYTNGTCPSILVEPQRTNLLTYSQDLNTGWIIENCSISANAITSPDGTLNADYIVEDSTASTQHRIRKIAVGLIATRTLSVYIKQGSGTRNAYIDAGVYLAYYNFSTQTATGVNCTAIVEDAPNGWKRFIITPNTASVSSNVYLGLANGTSETYSGDGTSSIAFWGAQFEAGSYATSYIPTTSASVTRNADVISKTGISSLIGQTEGTLFVDFVCDGFTDFGTPFCINDGSTANSIWITTFGNGTIRGEVFGFSNVQASFSMRGGVVGQRYKLALVYKANDFAMYVNGNLIGTDTSGSVPANLSRADFDYTNASSYVNSALKINTATLWKTRLTNTQLAQLTTI